MSGEQVQFLTPVGRIVMGDPWIEQTTDQQGRPLMTLQGQPKTQWFMALAIPKNSPEWEPFWQQIVQVGQRDFPGGEWNTPGFAWKVQDGDSITNNPHCAGHFIVKMTSGFAPQCVNSNNNVLTDPNSIKRGYYARCYIGVKGNDNPRKPGVYLNHQLVQLCGYGEEIAGGPDPNQVFTQPAALPAGASPTPLAPAGTPAAPMAQPGAPAPAMTAPAGMTPQPASPASPVAGAPQPAPTTASPSNPAVQPHPGILQPPGPVR